MNKFKNISDFNKHLIINKINITINEYINTVKSIDSINNNFNFSKFLFSLSKENKEYIKDDILYKQFNIQHQFKNENIMNNFVKKYSFIKDKDYIIVDNIKIYYSNIKFKFLLMLSDHKFINYYLFLDHCIYNYNNYQIQSKNEDYIFL